MSATIESKLFSNYFLAAPVLVVPGKEQLLRIFFSEDKVTDYMSAMIELIARIHNFAPQEYFSLAMFLKIRIIPIEFIFNLYCFAL